MDNRFIKLEGACNFRDIGGYVTKDNKRVKYHKLYRSDELSKLTAMDVKVIENLEIKTIIDYRTKRERNNNENLPICGTNVICLDIGAAADLSVMAAKKNSDKMNIYMEMSAELAKHFMKEQNEAFVRNPKCQSAFREMFKIILNEENIPVLQHCRGGKDRTGYGVALVLLVLGVSRENIIRDYMLTNHYKKEKNEKSLKDLMEKTKNADWVRAVRYFKEADESFLATALDIIDEDYGGIDNYMQQVLDVTRNDIEKLKETYLE